MEYINSVIKLMRNVINEEEKREVLQTDFQPMLNLLLDLTTLFPTVFPDQRKEAQEALKIWMQLLHNCLTEARSLLHRPQPGRPRRCLDRLICNPRTLSQEINEWKVLFDCLFQELRSDFSIFVTARQIIHIRDPIPALRAEESEQPLSKDEAASEEIRPLSEDPIRDLRAEESEQSLSEDDAASGEIQPQSEQPLSEDEAPRAEVSEQPLSEDEESDQPLSEDEATYEEIQPLSEDEAPRAEVSEQPLSEDEATYEEIQLLSEDEATSEEIQPQSEAPIPALRAEVSEQPLSEGEAWMLFQRIAFKDGPVPTDNIQLCATNIVDACKGSRSAISVVAAAMIGKTSLLDWQTSLDSMKIADPSFRPENHPRIDPQLYQLLRWSYDALPTSDLKNCFLSSAIYPEDAKINVTELVQMWIAEGFVRSKQESHLMDMAIARTYVNLLLDRRFFHNATNANNEEIQYYSGWDSDYQSIRVDGDIREKAMNIAEKEQNCLFKAGQGIQNFPTVHTEDCKRISLVWNQIADLPSAFTCPELVSLILSWNRISVVPSGFLVGLTSLKVLDLSRNEKISSIPSSVGQLQQLQLLRLDGLRIEHLPEEIGHLSSLQFLSLRRCESLESLPSQIGQLQNLKYLNLFQCSSLRVIPHEISQLTSLTTLDADGVSLSVEAESQRSICRLKGLINLTMLRITVDVDVKEGNTSSGIEGGIMGTWLDMRHLCLDFESSDDYVMDDLPDDMQNMRKLQSFTMWGYHGLSLPEYSCKFQHLQHLELYYCRHLKELSPLERLPSLTYLKLYECLNLKELGIFGKASGGFLMLEELVLSRLEKLESMAGPSNHGVWNERTLPILRILKIRNCPNLKRLPVGMDKLLNLKTIEAESHWWQQIIWENDHMKLHFANFFKER